MGSLSNEEYAAFARALDLPTAVFVDGGIRPAVSGKTFASVNSVTSEKRADVVACDDADVDFTLSTASKVFDDGRWSRMQVSARKDVLIRFARLLTRDARDLTATESIINGKTIFECETVDVPEAVLCIKRHADAIDNIYGAVAPTFDDHIAMVVRGPIGLVGVILPWNFSPLTLAWKIAPALAAGCSVIVKPAEETSLTALRVAELAFEAGALRCILNVLPGTVVMGKKFLSDAVQSNFKEDMLERGGETPNIVMDDAENLDKMTARPLAWTLGTSLDSEARLRDHTAEHARQLVDETTEGANAPKPDVEVQSCVPFMAGGTALKSLSAGLDAFSLRTGL